MHFVAALDSVPGLRGVLGLHETVCSGAADGYGRCACQGLRDREAQQAGCSPNGCQSAHAAAEQGAVSWHWIPMQGQENSAEVSVTGT